MLFLNTGPSSGRAGGCVYVVIAIDTEGPIDDPRKPEILSNWERVYGLTDRLFSDAYRRQLTDSAGHGPVLSWFVLTLTGFRTNPFKRAMGYHAVFDHYQERYALAMQQLGDGLYWHYHHPAPSGVGNEWCSDWTHCQEYDQILGRYVLDRGYFPSCYRAGGRIETDDTSWWLEEIIPFDYSSCSGNVNWEQRESDGKLLRDVCDWTRAPRTWQAYHPADGDYQAPGGQRRWMLRCPDLDSAVHRLQDSDIRQAFEEARAGRVSVLSFFEHDRRDITFEKLSRANQRIGEIAKEYTDIPWYFANAQQAAQAVTGTETQRAPVFAARKHEDARLLVTGDAPIFGRAPFAVAGAKDGSEVRRLAPLTVGQRKWLIDIPSGFDRIGIAANSPSGHAGVSTFTIDSIAQN